METKSEGEDSKDIKDIAENSPIQNKVDGCRRER